MTKPTWISRRRVRTTIATAGLMALATGFLPQVASASSSSLGDLRAEATQIAARINSLGVQEEKLDEQYDGAVIQQKKMIAKVGQAKTAVAKADSNTHKAAKALQQEAILSYVDSGSSGGNTSVKSADNSLLQAEYEESVASTQANAEDQFKLASETSATAETNLKQSEQAAANTVAQINADKASIKTTIGQLTSEESQAKGQIANLVYQDRMAAIRAAAAAEQRKLAAERAAAAAAAAATTTTAAPTTGGNGGGGGGGSTSPTTVSPPTTAPVSGGGGGGGGSSIGATAVSAATAEVGVPYVWGGGTPSGPSGSATAPAGQVGQPGFDCSGLVMYAYAQAGVSLPHYTYTQYADGTQISMADLAPGDLVFPSGLYHVAMYIGGGNIVQAPETGEDVQIVPLTSFFTLAVQIN